MNVSIYINIHMYYIIRELGGGNPSQQEGEGGAFPPIPLKKMGMALSIPLKKVELAPHPPKEESLHGALPPTH